MRSDHSWYYEVIIGGSSGNFQDLLSYHIFVEEGKKFEWTTKCGASFIQLKNFLTNAPVLKIAYPNK